MEDIKELFVFIGLLIGVPLLIVILILGVVGGVATYFEYNTCSTLQEMSENHEFQWVFYGGCRVKTPLGYWAHYTDVKQIEMDFESSD